MSYCTATACFDYRATQQGELTIKKDEKLLICDDSKSWWLVENAKHEQGYVPSNYVKRNKKMDPVKWFGREKKQRANGPVDQSEYAVPPVLHETVISKYNYQPTRADELNLKRGDKITVMEKKEDGWWYGRSGLKTGWFPSNYVHTGNEEKPVQPVVKKPVIHQVRTLYNFSPTNPEELSFKRGDMLEIIGKPEEDPEWWEARKENGSTGLVPKNYIELITNGDKPVESESSRPAVNLVNDFCGKVILPHHRKLPFVSEPWFWGQLSRANAERILTDRGTDGDFLVRFSETRVRM